MSEMGILCDDPASATIVANGELQIAALSRTSFAKFSNSHPYAALQITEAVSLKQKRHRISVALMLAICFGHSAPMPFRIWKRSWKCSPYTEGRSYFAGATRGLCLHGGQRTASCLRG